MPPGGLIAGNTPQALENGCVDLEGCPEWERMSRQVAEALGRAEEGQKRTRGVPFPILVPTPTPPAAQNHSRVHHDRVRVPSGGLFALPLSPQSLHPPAGVSLPSLAT